MDELRSDQRANTEAPADLGERVIERVEAGLRNQERIADEALTFAKEPLALLRQETQAVGQAVGVVAGRTR